MCVAVDSLLWNIGDQVQIIGSRTCQLSEELLMDLMEHGLLGELSLSPKEIQFDNDMLARIRAAHRLQHDLELNLQGVILALELLDEMSKMRDELDVLRRHVLL